MMRGDNGHPERVQVFNEGWLKQYQDGHPAWEERGLSPDIIHRFDLGYDYMKDVLTIPVRDEAGSLLGVVTRRLDDGRPKYRYPKGFPIGRYLFGAWMIAEGERRTVALVEGSIDAIACWDARVPALALLGSRITKDQVGVLKRLGVHTAVIFTDNDGPGRDAIPQVAEALRSNSIAPRVVQYRPYWRAKDPAELTPMRRRKAYHSALPWHRYTESGLQTE
jgi:DNA primase